MTIDDPVAMNIERMRKNRHRGSSDDAYLRSRTPKEFEIELNLDKPISVELPTSVVREITYTEPAVRGDTSGKVLKPAKLGSGLQVQVPLFVATGDRIEVDTRTGEYRRRV